MNPWWEYKIEKIKAGRFNERSLNKLGKQGWELISYVPLFDTVSGELTSYRLILKRTRAK